MKNRNIIFLWSIFCFNFIGQSIIASSTALMIPSNYVIQQFSATVESSHQSVNFCFLKNYADQIKLDMQRKLTQNILFSRVNYGLYVHSCLLTNDDKLGDEPQNLTYKDQLQKLCMMILLMLTSLPYGMLLGSNNRLPRSNSQYSNVDVNIEFKRALLVSELKTVLDIKKKYPEFKRIENKKFRSSHVNNSVTQQDVPLVESIEQSSSCSAIMNCPRSIRALPITYGTNIAGNLVAIGIALYSPNVTVASLTAGAVGFVGGCVEGYSTDHDYFSPNMHAWHNNYFTGYVADQVTGSCGSCFAFPILNAAAIGAPVGYACGLGSSLAMRSCLEGKPFKMRSIQFVQVPTQQQIER